MAEAEKIRPFASDADRQAYFDAALAQAQTLMAEAPDRVTDVRGHTPGSDRIRPARQLVRRADDHLGLHPAASASRSMFAYERQKGTLRRLLTTPTRKATYLLGTIIGQVASALVQMLLLVGFGILVMKLNWGQPAAGAGRDAARLGAGGGRAGHHAGHLRQDRRPGQRV